MTEREKTHSYELRRKVFLKAQENAKSQIFRDVLSDAIAHADVCCDIFVKNFVPAFDRYASRVRETCNKAMASTSATLKDAPARMAKAEQEGDVKTIQMILDESARAKKDLEQARDQLVLSDKISNEFNARANELFEKVFVEDSKYAIEAAEELLKYLVGLTPVFGDIVSGIDTALAILSRKKKVAATAEQYLLEIEKFLDATFIWALISYQAARSLEDSEKLLLSEANEHIIDMLQQRGAPMVWRPPTELKSAA